MKLSLAVTLALLAFYTPAEAARFTLLDMDNAADLSDAGGVVIGHVQHGFEEHLAIRWTSLTGSVLLNSDSLLRAVSGDGSTVVGSVGLNPGGRGFRWTAEEGIVDLAPIAGVARIIAFDVSADGSVVGGFATRTTGDHLDRTAFRWQEGSELQWLTDPIDAPGRS